MKFEIDKLLKKLDAWAAKQPSDQVRLVKGKPMTDAQIDKIPSLPKQFPFPLPTPYDAKRLVIPAGYRALLKRCGGLRLEVCSEEDGQFEPWGPFNIFRPGSCKLAHQGKGPTLCDSWSTQGTEVDDREITTTELLSFATMGFSTEASRWCFYIGGKQGPPSIYEESNDYECLAGRYVDDGTPLSELYKPIFPTFEAWFAAAVAVVTAGPLDLDHPQKMTEAIIARA